MGKELKNQNKAGKRELILAAAEEIIAQKGLYASTIAEISRTAGVTDSIIYQHFRGKRDLLFSIPAERMKEVLVLLDDAVKGIRDVESQLSKLVWFHLDYNDHHPGYARILLFECRSSSDFYQTSAYQLVRQYAGFLLNILDQGIKDGVFRSDLDRRLVRDIIFGTLNCETIFCFALNEIQESVSDFDDIVNLILPMVEKRPESRLPKADKILNMAEKVFSEKGFSGATIGEIAKSSGISEGLVYEYFSTKEDLLLSIPKRRFDDYLKELPETFQMSDPLRKLRRFIKYYYLLFLDNRAFLRMFLFLIEPNSSFYQSEAFSSFRKYFHVVEEIIKEGKEQGTFRSDVNPRVFRNMFLGAFSHIALRWEILGKGVDKIYEINQLTDLLCSAVLPLSTE